MSYLKENKDTILYGTVAITLAILGSSLAYYIIEDDRKVKHRKAEKLAHRNTLRLLNQMKEEDVLPIEAKISQVEGNIEDKECDEKAFKLKEYTLVHSNELLLRLMEKLDAIRPQSVIMTDSPHEPTEFELELISSIKSKKRTVIEAIQDLFKRLDIANVKVKKESERREEEAAKQAQLEKEEAERKAREEKELKELERKAREEQERLAQEEALRRQEEEKEAEKAALQNEETVDVLVESNDDLVILNKEVVSDKVEESTEETAAIKEQASVMVEKATKEEEEALNNQELVSELEPVLAYNEKVQA